MDLFSRMAFISTTKTQTRDQFIKLIDRVTRDKDVKIILADQYSALTSKDLKAYLRRRKIDLIFTSVSRPESNGLNERLNQTLVNRIRCKINSGPKKPWPKIADECVTEYNQTTHSVTKFSPEYLMNGKSSDIVPTELLETRNLEEDRRTAFKNSEKYFEKTKQRLDKNLQECTIKENDYVFVEHGSKLNRNKLDRVRVGPFRVMKKLSKTMFEIESGKQKKNANIVHSSKLIPVRTVHGDSGLGGEM